MMWTPDELNSELWQYTYVAYLRFSDEFVCADDSSPLDKM